MNSLQAYFIKLMLRLTFKHKNFGKMTPEEMRADFRASAAKLYKASREVGRTTLDADGIPAEEVTPLSRSIRRTVLYLHGGGYVLGSAETHRPITEALAGQADARIIAPDYRLAPEHKFPAAVEDAVRVYRWLLAEGTAPADIAVAGDSAGGGLAFALCLALRDRDIDLPGAVVGLSPWTDLTGSGDSVKSNAWSDPMLKPDGIENLATTYLAPGEDRTTPLASPLFGKFNGFPPTLIHVGSSEILLDDSTRLAEKLIEAGVEVELDIWDGMPHVWHLMAAQLPEARGALAKIATFLKAHVGEIDNDAATAA
ncbi:MAG: alpha/beta hydrolase [Alphaproteobacteria bacterium]